MAKNPTDNGFEFEAGIYNAYMATRSLAHWFEVHIDPEYDDVRDATIAAKEMLYGILEGWNDEYDVFFAGVPK